MRIGIIAEDHSDVAVVNEIIRKYRVNRFALIDFVGCGSGPIAAKCGRWARNLLARGCTRLILLRDSDGMAVTDLRQALWLALQPCPIKPAVVVIPVREVEAWLLSDEAAIKRALRLKKPLKRVPSPEAILDPKRKIAHEVQRCSERRITYLNTRHNAPIARECSLRNLRRCSSFSDLDKFIQEHVM